MRLKKVLSEVFVEASGDRTAAWPKKVWDVMGPHGIDFLDRVAAWSPMDRPSCAGCLAHVWLHGAECYGLGRSWPPGVFDGHRHRWTIVHGGMGKDVLEWLQQECRSSLADWKASSAATEAGGTKFIHSGKMVEDAYSGSVNSLPTKEFLRAPRLLAWLRAFKLKNKSRIAKFVSNAHKAVRAAEPHEEDGDWGSNCKQFLETSHARWFLTVGQLHIFEEPRALEEDRHFDGGASILHMGVTLFGRRDVVFYPDDLPPKASGAKSAKKAPPHIHADPHVSIPQMPGSVYLGVLTGCQHQVIHKLPRAEVETCEGHSVTCMLRTTLFAHNQSRLMVSPPKPRALFEAMAASFVSSFANERFQLPTLAEVISASASPDGFASGVGGNP